MILRVFTTSKRLENELSPISDNEEKMKLPHATSHVIGSYVLKDYQPIFVICEIQYLIPRLKLIPKPQYLNILCYFYNQ